MPKEVIKDIDGIGPCLMAPYDNSVVEIYETEGQAYDHTTAASIETNRCLIFSVGQSNKVPNIDEKPYEINFLQDLFGNAKNMQMYACGVPLTEQEVKERYDEACRVLHAKSPFSHFMVEEKDTGTYVGQTEIMDTTMPNTCEYGIALDWHHWNKGIGTEVTVAMSYFWAPHVREQGYKLKKGQEFENIYGTADPKNGTAKIFRSTGYSLLDTFEHPKYGLREKFNLSVTHATEVRDNTKKLQCI